jgi:AcrR family transcriptional regulator
LRISKPREERRQEIVETARELFIAQGIDNTPVSQIVKTVGVAQGLFYYYFKSKDDIIAAVADHIMDSIEKSINSSLEKKDMAFNQRITMVVDMFLDSFGILDASTGSITNLVYTSQLYDIIKARLTSTTADVINALMAEGTSSGALKIRHPELMVTLIIQGLAELIGNGLRERSVILDLIEQGLNLPENSLI